MWVSKLSAWFALLLGISNPVAAQVLRDTPIIQGANSSFSPSWRPLLLGAGGQITAVEIQPSDGTTVIRTDAYGAYLYNATGTCVWGATTFIAPCWQQLVTVTSLGINQATALDFMNTLNMGVAEITTCRSNTNVAYMITAGFLWVTQNLKAGSPAGSGVNWIQTTLSTATSGNTNQSKGNGKFIACDPHNPAVAVIATSTGTYYTTNGTSARPTFTQITGVGKPGTCSGGICPNTIAYDQNSATGGSPSQSQHLWIGTYGTGVYESTTGPGGTFNLTPGTQTTFAKLVADKFSQLWLTNGGNNVYVYKNGSGWATRGAYAKDTAYNIAIDPSSASAGANRIAVTTFGGQPNLSFDNGVTWTGAKANQRASVSATQPTWMSAANQNSGPIVYLSTLDIAFDISGNLWNAGGNGVWTTPTPVQINSTVWSSNSLGIEELVPVGIVSAPGNSPVVNVWDRGFFLSRNPDLFPNRQWFNVITDNSISDGWALDYATSNPQCLTGWQGRSNNNGGSSADSGHTFRKWTGFPSSTNIGGNIAASSCTNWILVPGMAGQALNFTTDGGASWNASGVPGKPRFVTTPGVRSSLAADRGSANTFCAVDVALNFYKSTDGGATFALTGAKAANVDGGSNADYLQSVPGKAGHFFWSSGGSGNRPHPNNTHLWKSTDGCSTWMKVSANLREVIAYGFGAAKPGGSGYPAIYAYGWLNGTLGLQQSNDGGATWASANIPSNQGAFPMGSLGHPYGMSGDANVYGRVYMGLGGNGYAYIDTQDACPWVNFSNVKPTASLTGTVTLTAQRSGLVPVTSVQFSVDGVNIGSPQTGAGPYSVDWVTGSVAPGLHTLMVQAIGNGCASLGNSFSIPITTR